MYSSSLLPPNLIERRNKIIKYNKKLDSINSNSCKELKNEINGLKENKEYQMDELNEMKNDELLIQTQRYQQQISQIQQERAQQIEEFKSFCVMELEKMKKEIEKTKEIKEIDIMDEIYNKWNEGKHKNDYNNNQRQTRHSRNRSNLKKNKLFPPKLSLDDDEIEMDLIILMNEAQKQNIEISGNIRMRKTQKKRTLKYKTNVFVNDDDRIRIESICNKIGIHPKTSTALYGYDNHLDVYQDIFDWITDSDIKQQKMDINELKSGKLRDIQSKLSSKGTIGKKTEMIHGINEKLKELTFQYTMDCD